MNAAEQHTEAEADRWKQAPDFLYHTGDRPLDGYTVKRGLGRGGFGEVYYALSDGGKETALKLIQKHLEVELRGVAHCLNLKHPNLVALYDIRQSAKHETWVVMEYIGGPSLADTLRKAKGPLPPEEALRWLAGIASAVDYLHRHGIVHRDLKPGNIFGEGEFVKLGDYGLSKFISVSRRSGQTESVGTVHYMAPEISTGHYGQSIDNYSAAVIAFELLTGDVPFDGESAGEILMKHLTAAPDLGKLDARVRGVLGKALAKDPADRYATATEMVDALRTAYGLAAAPAAAPAAARNEYAHADPEYQQYVAALARMRLAQGSRADLDLSMAAPPGTGKSQRRALADWLWGVFRAALLAPALAAAGAALLFAADQDIRPTQAAWVGFAAALLAGGAMTVGRLGGMFRNQWIGRAAFGGLVGAVLGIVALVAAIHLTEPVSRNMADLPMAVNLADGINPNTLAELLRQHPREFLRAALLFAVLLIVPNWRQHVDGKGPFSWWTAAIVAAGAASGAVVWTDSEAWAPAFGAMGLLAAVAAQWGAPKPAFAPPALPAGTPSAAPGKLRKLRRPV